MAYLLDYLFLQYNDMILYSYIHCIAVNLEWNYFAEK